MTQTTPQPASTPNPSRDRRAKRVFAVLAVVICVAVYFIQRNPPMEGWMADLPKALELSRSQNRKVVVMFTYSPAGEVERWLLDNTIFKNAKAIAKSGDILCRVALDDGLKSPVAAQYKVQEIPTLLLLSPEGKELNRRTGRVAETDFPKFLDGVPPPK